MAKNRKRAEQESPGEMAAPQSAGDTTVARGEVSTSRPDPDRVARRAYELYQARGGSDGLAMEDWLAAERELQDQEPRSRAD